MSWVLRAADPLDAGAVGGILADWAGQTDWMPQLYSGAEVIGFAGQMIDRGWVTLACSSGGRDVLGFLARDGCVVHALYVARRGQGIGGALIAQAQAEVSDLSLRCFAANRGAQRFYERQGFFVVDRGDGAENDEGLPDIGYQWRRAADSPKGAVKELME